MTEHLAKDLCFVPVVGQKAVLIKSKRGGALVGTIGVVVWKGTTRLGESVRIRVDQYEHWFSTENLRRYFEDVSYEDVSSPVGGWADFLAHVQAMDEKESQKIRKEAPKKGDQVTDGKITGKVFWVSPQGERIGVKTATGATEWLLCEDLIRPEPFWEKAKTWEGPLSGIRKILKVEGKPFFEAFDSGGILVCKIPNRVAEKLLVNDK